jgi:hypothetical protein
MGWEHLYFSWKTSLPEGMDKEAIECLEENILTFAPPLIEAFRRQIVEITVTQDQNLLMNVLKLIICEIKPLYENTDWLED